MSIRTACLLAVATCCLPTAAAAQPPDAGHPQVLFLQIVNTARGREQPRNASSPAAAHGAYRLVDRQLHWQLGDVSCDTAAELRKELDKLYHSRHSWVPDPQHPGALHPIPIEVDPDPHCTWTDVLATCDAVKGAKSDTLDLRAGWRDLPPGRAVLDPVLGNGELIVPMASNRHVEWRHVQKLLQDLDSSQPRFAMLQIAVSGRDDEAAFVEQHQQPK